MGNAAPAKWLSVGQPDEECEHPIDVTNLHNGYYVGAVQLTASGVKNSPLRVPVELSVFPQDGYFADPTTWAAVSGDNNKVSVKNVKPFTVSATVLPISPADGSWLVLKTPNPITTSSTSADVSFTVVPSALGGATGSAYITYTDAGSAAGTAGAQTLVTFTPLQVTVPNVAGQTQVAAALALQSAGLALGTVTMQSSTTVAAGTVISQNPAAGTKIGQGSPVALIVSSGPPALAVPNVTGMAQAAAITALQNAGFIVGTISNQPNATVPAGNVVSQNPAGGTLALPASTVTLVVSDRPSSGDSP